MVISFQLTNDAPDVRRRVANIERQSAFLTFHFSVADRAVLTSVE